MARDDIPDAPPMTTAEAVLLFWDELTDGGPVPMGERVLAAVMGAATAAAAEGGLCVREAATATSTPEA